MRLDLLVVQARLKPDHPAALPPSYIRQRLRLPLDTPVLPCVTHDLDSVKTVLLALLEQIDRSLVQSEPGENSESSSVAATVG